MGKINLINVTKYFGSVVAVDDVSLEINDKEFMVLLGPSGCGKTTTLRMVAGLETPTKGEIYIEDQLVNDVPVQKRDIAMVFQSYALYPHMSIYDNIAVPLKIRKVPKDEIKKRVSEVANLLGISDLLKRKPAQLSGGQRQRVALGRAIVRQPKAFLMDEPLSNLDAKLRVYMRAELKKLQKDLGITTVYVTHDQVEAMTMADRVAIMNAGKLQQLSSPYELFSKPRNLFVASFIGSPPMNFIECSFSKRGEKGYLDAAEFRLELNEEITDVIEKEAANSELTLGMRPEDLSISREKTSANCFPGEVYVVEPLGTESIVDMKVGEYLLKVIEEPTFTANSGERFWITPNMDRIYLFDRKTGNAII
ncbi:MAG: ABC transporter ATP-binding protein [Candidatus Bathyarchaeia archaeon]